MVEQHTIKNELSRMRTIRKCLAYIKSLDEETCISECFIRRLCKENKIPWFASGNKNYVNLDCLLSYLQTHGV